jgi:Mg2+-importing ATPase
LTTIVIVLVGAALPFLPVAHILGFVPLPMKFFAFLAAITTTYLLLVELVKRHLLHDEAHAAWKPEAAQARRLVA